MSWMAGEDPTDPPPAGTPGGSGSLKDVTDVDTISGAENEEIILKKKRIGSV